LPAAKLTATIVEKKNGARRDPYEGGAGVERGLLNIVLETPEWEYPVCAPGRRR